jgi:hypothetical protein
MRTLWIVITLAMLSPIVIAQNPNFGPPDRTGWSNLRMVKQICGACHSLDYYVREPRSFKVWELVLERMRTRASGMAAEYSRAESIQLAEYLASDPKELKDIGEHAPWDPETGLPYPPEPTATTETPAAPTDQPAPRTARPQRPKIPMPGPPKSLGLAKITSYLAVTMLAVLLVSGMLRKKLKPAFSPIHHTAALLLFVTIAIHASIHLVEFGPVPVLWLWFGIAAIAVLIATEGVGLLRKQLRKRFLRLHIIGGTLGALLTILHWIWAYL